MMNVQNDQIVIFDRVVDRVGIPHERSDQNAWNIAGMPHARKQRKPPNHDFDTPDDGSRGTRIFMCDIIENLREFGRRVRSVSNLHAL